MGNQVILADSVLQMRDGGPIPRVMRPYVIASMYFDRIKPVRSWF